MSELRLGKLLFGVQANIDELQQTLQQTRTRENQLKVHYLILIHSSDMLHTQGAAAAEGQRDHELRSHLNDALVNTLHVDSSEIEKCTSLSATTTQLLDVAASSVAKLAQKEGMLKHATPRPVYDSTPKLREGMLQLKMVGIDPAEVCMPCRELNQLEPKLWVMTLRRSLHMRLLEV